MWAADTPALVQFDLSTLPAGTTASELSRATLRLYCNRAHTPGLVSVQPVNGAWGEYSVVYATLPMLDSAAQIVQVNQASAYVTVDVTALVQGWIATPSTNNGLALTAGTAVVPNTVTATLRAGTPGSMANTGAQLCGFFR